MTWPLSNLVEESLVREGYSAACGFAGDGPHYACLLCGEQGIDHVNVTCADPKCFICRRPAEPEGIVVVETRLLED